MTASALLATALDMLHVTGAARLARPFFGGRGAIFMLHHVRPAQSSRGFAPNGGLEVTPAFLDQVVRLVKDQGYDCVSLDEMADRIATGAASDRPFAAFTLDDGYRDNLVHGLPVFRRHRCPFAIYVAPAIADGTCELWWRGLEALIAGETRLDVELAGERHVLDCATDRQKLNAWRRLYLPLRRLDQHRQRQWITATCSAHGIDLAAICRAEAMGWDEVRAISRDPLCTIGAHTVHHFALAQLDEDEARTEMRGSADRLEAELGRRPKHLAYPYGDPLSASPREFRLAREAGFVTAVTTRKGLIFGAHRDHLMALPRLSLSGDYQKLRYVEALLSGAPFALLNGMRRVKVA